MKVIQKSYASDSEIAQLCQLRTFPIIITEHNFLLSEDSRDPKNSVNTTLLELTSESCNEVWLEVSQSSDGSPRSDNLVCFWFE